MENFNFCAVFLYLVKFYNGDLLLPIFNEGRNQSTATKAIVEILVAETIPSEVIAFATPVYIKNNVEFVVKAKFLGH